MLRIEDKLTQTKASLQALREQVDQALADVPPALSLGENMNVQPVKLPLFVNAQLGFMAVYLLADYDDLARKLILAHHTADRPQHAGALAQRRRARAAQPVLAGPAVPLLRHDARRLRLEERGGAGGAGEVRRVAAGRARRHAPLALCATDRAAGGQARRAADARPSLAQPTADDDQTASAEGMTASSTGQRRFLQLEQARFAGWNRTSSAWNTRLPKRPFTAF
jgi:hypothetical protein